MAHTRFPTRSLLQSPRLRALSRQGPDVSPAFPHPVRTNALATHTARSAVGHEILHPLQVRFKGHRSQTLLSQRKLSCSYSLVRDAQYRSPASRAPTAAQSVPPRVNAPKSQQGGRRDGEKQQKQAVLITFTA